MEARCYLDDGVPRIEFEPEQDVVLERFFEAGIQSWPETVAKVAASAAAVDEGLIATWTGGANDYVAELTGDTGKIWSFHEDREITISVADFRQAAEAWRDVVESLDQEHLVHVDELEDESPS